MDEHRPPLPQSAPSTYSHLPRFGHRFAVRWPTWFLAATILLTALPVWSQDRSQADALFNQGLKDMRAGRYEKACPAFEKSYALDPLAGALFTLAECEAAWGRSATAMAHYEEFLRLQAQLTPTQQQKHAVRRKRTVERLASLTGIVPRVTVNIPANPPSDLVVKRDEDALDPMTYGVARPVDPGEHTYTAELDGKLVFERKLVLKGGDRATVNVVLPEAEAASVPGPVEPAPVVAPDSGGTDSRRTWGYVAGGVGIAGLGIGTVTGILAFSEKSTVDDNCVDRLCNPDGRSAVDSGKRYALVSTITFGVGLAGVAAGAWLLFGPGSSGSEQPQEVAPLFMPDKDGGLVGVTGAF